MKYFIINDENKINSYGFRVLTSGISLDRFNDNPVMLSGHNNDVYGVIGKWTNVQVNESNQLIADPQFDSDDENARNIEGKVARGFIKGASMGLLFERENMNLINGNLILTRCELMEVSIVAIPSNANSVRLFSKPGALMSSGDIALSLSDCSNGLILSIDDFFSLSHKDQLKFRADNFEGYQKLFSKNSNDIFTGAVSDLNSVSTIEQFQNLNFTDQLRFKNNYSLAYKNMFK